MDYKKAYYFYCWAVSLGLVIDMLWIYSMTNSSGLVLLSTNESGERLLEIIVLLSVIPGLLMKFREEAGSRKSINTLEIKVSA